MSTVYTCMAIRFCNGCFSTSCKYGYTETHFIFGAIGNITLKLLILLG